MVAISQKPSLIPEPFANSASGSLVNSIPDTVAGGSGLASWHLGWQLINGQPIGSGGIPPDLQDENGLLQQISAIVQWLAIGGPFPWTSNVANIAGLTGTYGSNGGYPAGAVVPSSTTAGLTWRSTVDNNTSNPDTGGANWVPKMRQAGTYTTSSPGNIAVTFPTAFPSGTTPIITCTGLFYTTNTISIPMVNATTTTNTGFTGALYEWNGSASTIATALVLATLNRPISWVAEL